MTSPESEEPQQPEALSLASRLGVATVLVVIILLSFLMFAAAREALIEGTSGQAGILATVLLGVVFAVIASAIIITFTSQSEFVAYITLLKSRHDALQAKYDALATETADYLAAKRVATAAANARVIGQIVANEVGQVLDDDAKG